MVRTSAEVTASWIGWVDLPFPHTMFVSLRRYVSFCSLCERLPSVVRPQRRVHRGNHGNCVVYDRCHGRVLRNTAGFPQYSDGNRLRGVHEGMAQKKETGRSFPSIWYDPSISYTAES
jgi:hypothetical protein